MKLWDQMMISFDVSSLFTSVPTDKAVEVIQERLEQDSTLGERTTLNPQDIVELLKVVLNTTYFQFCVTLCYFGSQGRLETSCCRL